MARHTSQLLFKCFEEKPRIKNCKMKKIPAWDAKKVRSQSEALRQGTRMDKQPLREFGGPLSLEERRTCKAPPTNTRSEWCSWVTTSKTKKDTEQHS